MKRHNISENESAVWSAIAKDLQAASDLVSSAMARTLDLSGLVPPSDLVRTIDRIASAASALSGLGYLCTPQSEWTGNNAAGEGTWVVNTPHIVNGGQ